MTMSMFPDFEGPIGPGPLAEVFEYRPFSVLDARNEYWKLRKDQWLSLFVQTGGYTEGREDNLLWGKSRDIRYRKAKNELEMEQQRHIPAKEFEEIWAGMDESQDRASSGTSAFDPVLAEILIKWYCPKGGIIWDPFAGAVERGAVAVTLGCEYFGVELRKEQIEANIQAFPDLKGRILEGDSTTLYPPDGYRPELILTCPPYWNLEKYSNRVDDLSNLGKDGFKEGIKKSSRIAYEVSQHNAVAAWVIGDARDSTSKTPRLARIPQIVEEAILESGWVLIDKLIYLSPYGSATMVARRQFSATRTTARTHQEVIVAIKGDARSAAEKLNKANLPW